MLFSALHFWIELTMKSALFFILWGGCLAAAPALAHNGEDHGVTPAMVGQTLEPRFEARGSLAEITGILSEGQLWVFATHAATSEPWPKLKIEVESGGQTVQAAEKSSGIYLVKSGQMSQPGRHALTLTLQGDGLEELLTGTLVNPSEAASPKPTYGWMVAALAVLAALYFLYRRLAKR